MKITNKQILDELNVIQDKLPNGDNYISGINKTVNDISVNQDDMRDDIRQMMVACKDRRFGCVDYK
jgi:hypothetical protein